MCCARSNNYIFHDGMRGPTAADNNLKPEFCCYMCMNKGGRYPRISVHSSVFPFRGRGGAGSFLEEEQAAAEAQGVVGSRSSRQMSTR